ncbi:MAG: GNAT family N-acetyltransferase [Gaiellaceae bacterium]
MAIHIEPPKSTEQIEAWAEMIWCVEGLRIDVDELRHSFEQDTESLWALAYLDGAPAGIGVGRPSSLTGADYAAARVLPELRGRGVGSALLAAIAEHARAHGATELWGRIRADDEATLAFAERRGFREVGRERDVLLDLSKVPEADADLPSGITLVTFAERPDLIRAVFAVDTEVSVDVPTHGTNEPMTYEDWSRENLEGPGAFPEGCVIAVEGDEVVGYTALRRYGAGSPDAENRLTAVRRPWRRRGIASALKRAQIEAARTAGIETISTTNDELNVGMRGVNERLGYEPKPERVVVSGPA